MPVWKKRTLALVLGGLVSGSIIVVLELALGEMPPPPLSQSLDNSYEYQPQPWGTYKGLLMLPLRSHRAVAKRADGTLLWDRVHSIDEYSRRILPAERMKLQAKQFILILGDSYGFGFGVQDDQTFPAFLGGELPRYRLYNYSIPGLFPGELLDRLRLVRGAPEIRESTGVAIYFFSLSHIFRNMGEMSIVGRWARKRPYYFEDSQGNIVAQATFQQARPWWTAAASVFARSRIVRYFGWTYPARVESRDIQFQRKIFEALRRESARLGAKQFYVVFSPEQGPWSVAKEEVFKGLILQLNAAAIPYLDLSRLDLQALSKGPAYIEGDGHYAPEGNRALAAVLRECLPWAEWSAR